MPAPERIEFRALNRAMSVVLFGRGGDEAIHVSSTPHWFARWQERLSRYDSRSELYQLNRDAGAPMRVSATLLAAIRASLATAHLGEGLVSPLLSATDSRPRRATEDLISIDSGARTVSLSTKVRLDLSSTIHGWAADRAAARLASTGPALVEAGADIAISGPLPSGEPWTIVLPDPGRPDEILTLLFVGRGGISTVTRQTRHYWPSAEWQQHVLDPRTARPCTTDVLSATVIADRASVASVAARVVYLRGARDGIRWLETQPGLAGFALLDDGRMIKSKRLASFESDPVQQLFAETRALKAA